MLRTESASSVGPRRKQPRSDASNSEASLRLLDEASYTTTLLHAPGGTRQTALPSRGERFPGLAFGCRGTRHCARRRRLTGAAAPPSTARAPSSRPSRLTRWLLLGTAALHVLHRSPQPTVLQTSDVQGLGSGSDAEAAPGNAVDAAKMASAQAADGEEQPAAAGEKQPEAGAEKKLPAGMEPAAAQQEGDVGQAAPVGDASHGREQASREPELPDVITHEADASLQPTLQTFTADIDALDCAVDETTSSLPSAAGAIRGDQGEAAQAEKPGSAGRPDGMQDAATGEGAQHSHEKAAQEQGGQGSNSEEDSKAAEAALAEQASLDLSNAEADALDRAVEQAEQAEQRTESAGEKTDNKEGAGEAATKSVANAESGSGAAGKGGREEAQKSIGQGAEKEEGATAGSVASEAGGERAVSGTDPLHAEGAADDSTHKQPAPGTAEKAVETQGDTGGAEAQQHDSRQEPDHRDSEAAAAATGGTAAEEASGAGLEDSMHAATANACQRQSSQAEKPASAALPMPTTEAPQAEERRGAAPRPNGHSEEDKPRAAAEGEQATSKEEQPEAAAEGASAAFDPLGLEEGDPDVHGGALEQVASSLPACACGWQMLANNVRRDAAMIYAQ